MPSQPGTNRDGKPGSSRYPKIRRLARNEEPLGSVIAWATRNPNKQEIQTTMAVLDCTAAEATQVFFLNAILTELHTLNAAMLEEEDDLGPGANPEVES